MKYKVKMISEINPDGLESKINSFLNTNDIKEIISIKLLWDFEEKRNEPYCALVVYSV